MQEGRKFDEGKLRYDLVPVLAFEEMTKVLTAGSLKYDDNNWRQVPDGRRRYLAAALRHIQDYRKGNIYDDGEGGTGTHHLANAITDLMFILEKDLQGWEDIPDSSAENLTMVQKFHEGEVIPPKLESSLWYPDDSGNWVEVPEGNSVAPYELHYTDEIEAMYRIERMRENYEPQSYSAGSWKWDEESLEYQIVAYKKV